jgi:hypothetical protein
MARKRGFLPQFQALAVLEFHGAAHNIGGLGIRRLLGGLHEEKDHD